MKRNKLSIIALSLFLLSGLSSCMDMLKSDEPIGLLTEGEEPSTSLIETSVFSSYEMLSNKLNIVGDWDWDNGLVNRNDYVVQDIASDDFTKKWNPDGDQPWMDEVDNFSFIASNGAFNGIWVYDYEGVSRCNKSLSFLTDDELLASLEFDGDLRDRLLGEVYFLRAFYYFDLVTNFSGVPLLLEQITNFEDAYSVSSRATKDEVYAQIEDDLALAKMYLPKSKYADSSERWRASYGAAVAMLAKVALFEENWDGVISNINELEALGYYGLDSNYFDSFDVTKEYSDSEVEVIFSYNHESDMQPARGNGLCALAGWGFLAPTQDFLDAFEANDPRKEYTVNVDMQYLNKLFGTVDGTNKGNDDSPSNTIYIRYADVLLWKAEAYLNKGELSNCIDIINQIRERARNTTAIDGSTPPVGTLADRDQTETDTDIIKSWLMYERRVELGGENHRMRDLKRWGEAKEVLNAVGVGYNDYNDLYPIPQDDIDKTAGVLEQNPGY